MVAKYMAHVVPPLSSEVGTYKTVTARYKTVKTFTATYKTVTARRQSRREYVDGREVHGAGGPPAQRSVHYRCVHLFVDVTRQQEVDGRDPSAES